VEMQWDSSTFKHGLLFASVVEGSMWKCSVIAMQLRVDCKLLGFHGRCYQMMVFYWVQKQKKKNAPLI